MNKNKENSKRSAEEHDDVEEHQKKLKTDSKQFGKKFRYGNYNRYYGYRNANQDKDKRITVFQEEWFKGKCCLDIGCNVGHLTLWLAKHFMVKSMRGVDIDPELVKAAKNNIVHYVDEQVIKNNKDCQDNNNGSESCGNIENEEDKEKFPYNVSFVTENFVPASDNILKYVKPKYDVIMCMSVTKWIQLNEGDDGLKRLFKKIYLLLNENGLFVIEPQPFNSYKRRKNLTSEIRENYENIKLLPQKYTDFLLSEEIGFKTMHQIGKLDHEKEGFQRPIYVLRK